MTLVKTEFISCIINLLFGSINDEQLIELSNKYKKNELSLNTTKLDADEIMKKHSLEILDLYRKFLNYNQDLFEDIVYSSHFMKNEDLIISAFDYWFLTQI